MSQSAAQQALMEAAQTNDPFACATLLVNPGGTTTSSGGGGIENDDEGNQIVVLPLPRNYLLDAPDSFYVEPIFGKGACGYAAELAQNMPAAGSDQTLGGQALDFLGSQTFTGIVENAAGIFDIFRKPKPVDPTLPPAQQMQVQKENQSKKIITGVIVLIILGGLTFFIVKKIRKK